MTRFFRSIAPRRWRLVATCLAVGLIGCGTNSPDESAANASDTAPNDSTGGANDAAQDTAAQDTAAKDAALKDTAVNDTAATDTDFDVATGAADTGPAQPPDWLDECQSNKDCAKYGDNNPCNGVLRCDKTAAPTRCVHKVGSTVSCPTNADHVCAVNTCQPGTGACAMTPQPKGVPCVDGDPCTIKSACDGAGQCKPITSVSACGCKTSSDCAVKTKANPCAGSWFCAKETYPWACKLNPATAVKCPANKDTGCSVNACQATTGKCAMVAVKDGTPCDDGDKLTLGDACKAGLCKPGLKPPCKKHADCDVEEDGDLCNGVLFCDKGTGGCKVNPKTVISCPSVGDTACTLNSCDPKTGACNPKAVKNGTVCDDGVKCTAGDICIAGKCKGGVNTCACKADADCAKEEDGNLCNGTLFCNAATKACQLNPTTIVSCPTVDDTDCVKSTCTPKTGTCQPKAVVDGGACDDGDKCTAKGSCAVGKCVPGPKICFCTNDADCDKEDDGDKCNGTMFCDKSGAQPKCKLNPATVVKCASVLDGPCRKNLCAKLTGKCALTNLADGLACDDNNACTKNDACGNGDCKAGASVCECQVNADCASKDDNDLCNGTLYCDKSGKAPKCKLNPASVVVCPATKAGPCLFNGCDPILGKCKLQGRPDGSGCDDGSVCSLGDACAKGQCVGKARDCNDDNQCTTDTCIALTGCKNTASNCNDGNDCTLDLCNKKTGKCAFDSKPRQGKSCNGDNDGCTVADTCNQGVCAAGHSALCQVKTGPCQRAVCVSTAATSFKCQVVSEVDGTGCDDNKSCTVGAMCAKGQCQPGTADRLFLKSFGATDAGIRAHGVAELPGGDLVLVGQWRPSALKGKSDRWWMRRVDVAGQTKWTRYLPMVAAEGPRATAVVAQSGGVAVVGVKATGKHQGGHAAVVRLSDAGTITSETAVGTDKEGFEPLDAASTGVGGLVLVGRRYNGAALIAHARQLSSQGTQRWQRDFGTAGRSGLKAVATLPTGGAWLAGMDGSNTDTWGTVTLVDGFGKPLKVIQLEKTPVEALAAHSTGALIVAATRKVGSVLRSDTWRIDPARKIQWRRFGTAGDFLPSAVAFVGNMAVTAGTFGKLHTSGQFFSKSDGWLSARDTLGNQVWEGVRDAGGVDHIADIVATSDGGLAAVGWTQGGGDDKGLLLRTDGWGHSSCAASGSCLAKSPNDCADKDPCTLDRCAAKAGCTHLPTDAIVCGDGDGCVESRICKATKCVAAPNQRLKTVVMTGWSNVDRIAVAPDNGIVAVVTESSDNKTFRWSVRRYSSELQQQWSWSRAPFPAPAYPYDVAVAVDGTVAMAGYVKTNQFRAHVLLVSKDGKTGKDRQNVASEWAVQAVNARSDGHFDMLCGKALVKMSTSGAILKQIDIGFVSGDMLATETGRLVIAGNGGTVAVYNTHHAKVFQTHFKPPVAGLNPLYPQGDVIALLTDGTMVSQWTHWPKGGTTHADRVVYHTGMSATGKLLWTSPPDNLQNPSKSRPDRTAVAMSDGTYWAFANSTSNTPRPFMQRYGRLGNVIEERTLDVGVTSTHRSGTAPVPLDNGDYVVAVIATIKGKKTPMLTRVSGFMAPSCAAAGKCANQTVKSCDDGKACTWDLCDPKTGCVHTLAAECDDGDPCTVDGCGPANTGVGKWTCTHGAKDCDDNDKCTVDSCAPNTVKGAKVGQCTHAKSFCDDGNDCTSDSCDAAKGCVYKAVADGDSCVDSACYGRQCAAGKCTKGSQNTICGSQAKFAARSCALIKLKHPKAITTAYYIDPDGKDGPAPSLYAYCDMTTSGGGWTMVMGLAGTTPPSWHMYDFPSGTGLAELKQGTGNISAQTLAPRDWVNKVVANGSGEYLTCSGGAPGAGWLRFNKDGFDAFRGIWDIAYLAKSLKGFSVADNDCPPKAGIKWKAGSQALAQHGSGCPGSGCHYIPSYIPKSGRHHWVHRHNFSPAAGNGKVSRVWVR